MPGLTQFVKRGNREWATVSYNSTERKFVVSVVILRAVQQQLRSYDTFAGFSWATMLLPRDRTFRYLGPDRFAAAQRRTASRVDVLIPPIDTFICPSDRDITSQPDLAGLSLQRQQRWMGPTRDSTGSSLRRHASNTATRPKTAFSTIWRDTTHWSSQRPQSAVEQYQRRLPERRCMFAENIHKTYESTTSSTRPTHRRSRWLFGNTEQQLGFVWVVPASGSIPPQRRLVTRSTIKKP